MTKEAAAPPPAWVSKLAAWRTPILILVGLVFCLPGFFSLPPTDRDESNYAQASRQMMESGEWIDIRFQDAARHKKPVGIYWLQVASAALVGGAEAPIWAYRIPSLLGALASILLTGWFAARWFGREAGLLAGLLVAATLLLGYEARTAKTDALLFALITLAMIALGEAYVAARDGGPVPRWLWPAFWVSIGLGVLVKGPIILVVVFSTLLLLFAWDRRVAWFGALRPLWGFGLVLLLVLPWLIAITVKTEGAFLIESVRHEFFDKVASNQDSHGAPPGYYLLTLWLTLWPTAIFVALMLPWAWQRRQEARFRFCLAWIFPTWLIFELVVTKLPHYMLPIFPAFLALVAARFVRPPRLSQEGWRLWLRRGAVVMVGIATLVLGAGLAILRPATGGSLDVLGVLAGLAALATGAWVIRWAWFATGSPPWRAMIGGAFATYVLGFGLALPNAGEIWLSQRLADRFAELRPCPTSVLASAGYGEPSLVFLAGTETVIGDGQRAAQHLASDRECAVAAVSADHQVGFAAEIKAQGLRTAKLGEVQGFNYSRGKRLNLVLYRAAGG